MGEVGAAESTIEAAENRLRQRFPDDHRTFLRSKNGLDVVGRRGGNRCGGARKKTANQGSMMRPARASKPDGSLLGSYRVATAPEPNSSRLTSFKSTCFDSPANNVGPWPASLGCTTNSYSSINPSSVNAIGSFTPPTNSPLPDSRLSC